MKAFLGSPWLYVIGFAVAFGAGWSVNGWRLDASYQAKDNAVLQAAIKDRNTAKDDLEKLTAKLAENNDAHTAQLKKVQNENNTLRNRVSAGSVGLRVAATCHKPTQAEPTSDPGVDHGTRPELDPASRPDYFALRDGINQVTEQLGACQGELRIRQ